MEESGMSSCSPPALQSSVPAASVATTLITHVLVGVEYEFGRGSGAPNRQPAAGQSRLDPVSVDDAAASRADCPVQDVMLEMNVSRSGTATGSGTEVPPPPK